MSAACLRLSTPTRASSTCRLTAATNSATRAVSVWRATAMYATKKRRESGMVMILVLVLVALLLIVALAVITGSNNAAASATAVSIKYRVLNSAEGAANYALNDLAANPLEAPNTHLRGSLNGAAWDALILANNLTGGQTQVTDPATGLPVDVPAGHAYVYGVAAEKRGHTPYI